MRNHIFPQRLRALRERTYPIRSQKAVSELMGLSPDAIRRYERGEAEPKMEALGRIADYYGVSVDYLMGRTDYKNRPPCFCEGHDWR